MSWLRRVMFDEASFVPAMTARDRNAAIREIVSAILSKDPPGGKCDPRDRNTGIRKLLHAFTSKVRRDDGGCSGDMMHYDDDMIKEAQREVIRRENMGSTGFGKGVATPHTKLMWLKDVQVGWGRCPDGIDFAALDRAPVYVVFCFLSPLHDREGHLRVCEAGYRFLHNDNFRRFFRQSETEEALKDLLEETMGVVGLDD